MFRYFKALLLALFGLSTINVVGMHRASPLKKTTSMSKLNIGAQQTETKENGEKAQNPRFVRDAASAVHQIRTLPREIQVPVNHDLFQAVLADCPEKIDEVTESIKQRDTIEPRLVHKHIFLIGESGTGKSTLARAIADRCNLPCHVYDGSAIADEYKASGNKNLERIFERHAQDNKPCFIIVDELQEILKKYRNVKDGDQSMATTLWNLLDDPEYENIFFIGTLNYTNKKLPAPFLNRFGKVIIEMPLPSEKQREKVIAFNIKQYAQITFEKDLAKKLAKRTQGLSHRELAFVIEDAVRPIKLKKTKRTCVTLNDCLVHVKVTKKSSAKTFSPKKRTFLSKLTKYAVKAGPYIFTVACMAVNFYMQKKLAEWQMGKQEEMHLASAIQSEFHHIESLDQSGSQHEASMGQSRTQHEAMMTKNQQNFERQLKHSEAMVTRQLNHSDTQQTKMFDHNRDMASAQLYNQMIFHNLRLKSTNYEDPMYSDYIKHFILEPDTAQRLNNVLPNANHNWVHSKSVYLK